mmetsp:Transcript_34982/g.52850  ORF Transcript_34982/g.52850 Transcript_34982/m.52850 type:complete len:100 (+) Transcript_34982:185-484(+)
MPKGFCLVSYYLQGTISTNIIYSLPFWGYLAKQQPKDVQDLLPPPALALVSALNFLNDATFLRASSNIFSQSSLSTLSGSRDEVFATRFDIATTRREPK